MAATQPTPYSSTIEPNADAEFPAEKGRYHLNVTYSFYQKTKPDDENGTHLGWVFVSPETTPSIKKVSPKPRKFSVPVLWDKKKQAVVSEESAGILHTLNSAFRENGLPAEISMSVIKSLFSKSSETAREELRIGFVDIAKLEALLCKQCYVVSNSVTEADIHLVNTLICFDVSQKKTNKQELAQFPNVVGASARGWFL
ncbi:hypothetical protein PHYPSEUDO_015182 [Phytophthora pseudosyringae]|uniref:GST C-terminal domain-containing protein n=1 Tax=Phytophthora pseudosyringae TaxID=221518 RepID=A0A8T1VZD1_9STRA|nr:hypothetical protein PHYPSEUDO_015182 [Phytophthora pseudosyringae]